MTGAGGHCMICARLWQQVQPDCGAASGDCATFSVWAGAGKASSLHLAAELLLAHGDPRARVTWWNGKQAHK